MNSFKKNDRVVVDIKSSGWAMGAAESMNGACGVVREVKTYYASTGYPLPEPMALVRFDSPCARWWGNGPGVDAFHIPLADLKHA